MKLSVNNGNHSCAYLTVRILLALLLIPGCNKDRSSLPEVSYTDPVLDSCTNEPGHKYYISMPENINAGQGLPLIIAIDPQGDGYLAVRKFAGALGSIPTVIVGSERLRNNYEGFEASITSLYEEVPAKYPVDPEKIIIAGFSGGARMAYYYGMNHRVSGIIMYGAGPGKLPVEFGQKRLYAVSGTRDFNFMEQYVPLFTSLNVKSSYFTDFFRGTHEWPPAQNIYESVVYILQDGPEVRGSVLEDLSDEFLSEYDSLLRTNDLFFAGKALEKAWCFVAGIKSKEKISGQINEFKNMPDFLDYQKKFEAYLQKEIRLKQAYAGKLTDPDTAWWHQEINSMISNLSTCTDSTQKDYYYRVKGFTGIILYAWINNLLQKGIFDENVNKLLVIYEQAEPESPDLFYFKALVQHHNGNDREAQKLLEQAIEKGFSDIERIQREIPSGMKSLTGD